MALASGRNRRHLEEGESAFVSMTDLSVSFLFIILVLLAFFATQFRPEDTVSRNEHDTLVAELSDASEEIRRLNEALAAKEQTVAGLHGTEARLRDELTAARATARSLSARIEELKKKLAAVSIEHDTARDHAASLATEIDELKRAVSDLKREVARLLERIKELETPDPLAEYLERVSSVRTALLQRLAERIRKQLPGIRVTVVAADGVIRFRGDDLFETGQWRIRADSTADRVSRAVGDALADTLPCYTVGDRAAFEKSCNGAFAAIETIQIEGHTDDVPLSGALQDRERMLDNHDLSARRGAETLRAMTDRYRPELIEFLNLRGQPVLSFAGYGAFRPIDRGDSAEARAANRRIDIRFILQTPQNLREVEEIRNQLTRNRPNLPPIVEEDTR